VASTPVDDLQTCTGANEAEIHVDESRTHGIVLGGPYGGPSGGFTMSFTKAAANAARREDRLRQEAGATKLRKEVPSLSILRIAVTELGMLTHQKHMKHVVVGSAPALFIFHCGDELCEGGGHDVTSNVLYSLRALRTEFTGQHSCDGTVGCSPCRRSIEFRAFAEYAG
jgi:hypothetical protein